MRRLIRVTQKHIDEGEPFQAELCPIALALKETLGVRWTVNNYTAWRTSDPIGSRSAHELSASAEKFIRDFDAGHPVEPFSFYFGEPS
jgi:hypothetical protein